MMATWDVGDLVPLALIVPDGDGTTATSVTYVDPNGGTGSATTPSTSDGGVTWTTNQTVGVSGVWTFIWTITGKGAGVEEYTISVTTTPPVPWTPALRDVADLIPDRTIPRDSTSGTPLMTFTTATIPSSEQAYRQIRSATRWVAQVVGVVAVSLYGNASDVASLRAAGMLELSLPTRDEDLNTARD